MSVAWHTIRALRWKPPAALALVALASSFAVGIGDEFDMAARFLVARASLLVLAAGLGFLVDDPAASMMSALHTPLRRRRVHRLMAAAGPWVLAVVAVLLLAARNLANDPDNPFPSVRLGVEALGLASIARFLASILGRRTVEPGGQAAALMLMGGIAVASIRPPFQPWMTLWDPQYTGMSVGAWWVVIGVVVWRGAIVSWDARAGR